MASTTHDKPPSLATAANAKPMMATDRGNCQRLKEVLVNEEDATTVVVVMSAEKPTPASMHRLLAEAACQGSCEKINLLLHREDLQGHSSNLIDGRSAMQQGAADVEKGINNEVPLLEGVTLEGDTALHLVAANGDGRDFIDCADLIHGKNQGFLSRQNYKGDTPLHYAARSGRSKMLSHLIGLARGENIVELLRQGNCNNETVLHVAVRNRDSQLVKDLLAIDPSLACFPKEGTSPLYLAILLEADSIAQMLYDKSENNVLSYSGPNGQNALHAAVLRGPGLTRKLLDWNTNKDLTSERDANGSTPLHFAACLPGSGRPGSTCAQVFDATPSALYEPDNDGLSPIHVAAAVCGQDIMLFYKDPVAKFVDECPSSAGLRDAKGRTFLHVAVEKKNLRAVKYACTNESIASIMNMQDNDGNTALHLAVKDGSLDIFRVLFGNRQVNLNLTNRDEETPLDIARKNVRPSFYDGTADPEVWIRRALEFAGARIGASRQDHFNENYENCHGVKTTYKDKEMEMLKDSTQSQSIGPVLIATVTFGAMFALPGGYRADDNKDYGGTPTLAGAFAFHAFMIANTLAFVCSTIATLASMYAGSARFNLARRKTYFAQSIVFMHNSIMALTVAFALGVYTVLAPVAQKTAIVICVMSPLVVLYNFKDFWLNWAHFAKPLFVRKGAIWTLRVYTQVVLANMFSVSWLILIFVWAAYGRNYPISKAV